MRDTSVSDDDLAIQLAKEKLLQLPARPGYEAAMHPAASRSRKAQLVSACVAIAFIALTVGVWSQVGTLWLRVPLLLVLGAIDLLALLLIIGTAPEKPPIAWATAVLAKPAASPDKPDLFELSLLRADGEVIAVSTAETIHATLRPGDVGVAHVRVAEAPAPSFVAAFHRL